MDFTGNASLILIAPLVSAFLIFIFSFMNLPLSRRFTAGLTVFASFVGLLASLNILQYFLGHQNTVFDNNYFFFGIGDIKFYWGFYIDNLSALMLTLVSSISMLVQLYSYGYMRHDEGFPRFFVYLNLFNFTMYSLVLSTNLVQAYIFWELVGLMSYLLIGFWFKKESASKAARKAFWVNRIGDCALFMGIVALLTFALSNKSIASLPLLGFSDINSFGFYAFVALGTVPFTLLCLALVLGPVAKSAQIPLHTWLPDAMEGPTPISALIHSATMVGAGVFLIARLYPLLILSPATLKIIAALGILTALICGAIALVQNDIKRLLAYSTSSQLGFMFLGLGAGAYSGAIFHLVTHAYFKAMLFLCVGAVIHSTLLNQDIRFLGGLRKHMPLVAYSYLIGCFSLSGLFLSGFYSKEMILTTLFSDKHVILLILAVLAAVLSIIYIFRSYFLIFEGEYKGSAEPVKPHWTLVLPVVILALPSAFLGIILNKDFQNFIYAMKQNFQSASHSPLEIPIIFLSIFILWLVFRVYYKKDFEISIPQQLYEIFKNKFYFDKFYTYFYENVFLKICKFIKFLEKAIIGGLAELCVILTRLFAYVASRGQNGSVSTYVFSSLLFITLFTLIIVMIYFKAGG